MPRVQSWLDRLSFEHFATALFFIVIGAAACLMPAQNDTWWQLRAGQEIVGLRSVPLSDGFSHTRAGEYWPNHEWLAQVVLYALYTVGGLPLVTLAAAAAVTGAWLIVWHLTPGTTWRRIGLMVVAMPVFAHQWSLRPQVLTLFLLALTLFLLVRGGRAYLPLVFAVWANAHGGAVLGIAVVAAAMAGTLIHERRFRWGPVGVVAACVLATTLTPLGLSFWIEIPAALMRPESRYIAEWKPPGLTDLAFAPYWAALAGLVALALLAKPWRAPQSNLLMVTCAALALAPVSLSAVRNTPPFLLLAVPALGALLAERFPPGVSRTRRERPLMHAVALASIAVGAMAAVGHAWISQAPRLQWRPMSPSAIAAVVSCGEPLYNRYDDGGYLTWFVPERKVFLDSRQYPYPTELITEHIRVEVSGDYESLFRRYAIGCVFTATDSLLARRLARADWHRIYRDDRWVVLARGNARPASAGHGQLSERGRSRL